jgi:anhydro-N-acetylmuramic acid kinase
LGVTVVDDFRSADVAAGGHGAPLLPVYHRALITPKQRPALVLNLGGVANITAIGADGSLIACDTGMASGLIDDWMLAHHGVPYDVDGVLAAQGQVDEVVLAEMLAHPFFAVPPPKSLDRADFTTDPVAHLSVADGAATLTAFSAAGVARVLDHLPIRPKDIFVTGGGRKNATLMRMIATYCHIPVHNVDALGWNGDATEAEGFAYMAVRRLRNLPISFPGTTGVSMEMTGGVVHLPA